MGITIPAAALCHPALFLLGQARSNRFAPRADHHLLGDFFSVRNLLLRSYLLSFPREFESTRVDGANELQTLLRIVLSPRHPRSHGRRLRLHLMSWNEFFFAITFIQSEELKPVTISFLAFQGRFDTNWGLTSAAGSS